MSRQASQAALTPQSSNEHKDGLSSLPGFVWLTPRTGSANAVPAPDVRPNLEQNQAPAGALALTNGLAAPPEQLGQPKLAQLALPAAPTKPTTPTPTTSPATHQNGSEFAFGNGFKPSGAVVQPTSLADVTAAIQQKIAQNASANAADPQQDREPDQPDPQQGHPDLQQGQQPTTSRPNSPIKYASLAPKGAALKRPAAGKHVPQIQKTKKKTVAKKTSAPVWTGPGAPPVPKLGDPPTLYKASKIYTSVSKKPFRVIRLANNSSTEKAVRFSGANLDKKLGLKPSSYVTPSI